MVNEVNVKKNTAIIFHWMPEKTGECASGSQSSRLASVLGNIASVPDWKLFAVILSIRIANALTINTFFQADEYWQALEPAHVAVFGYGYLTWEWKAGIRSFLHPLLYALIYRLCLALDLGETYILALPKVLNAFLAAIGELYLRKLSFKLTKDPLISSLTLLLSVFSSFNWFCLCRSFSNSLELILTIVALYWLPFDKTNFSRLNFAKATFLAAICCIVRPTNAIIWVFFGLKCVLNHPKRIIFMVGVAVSSGLLVLGLDALLNRWFYGFWTFPVLNFLEFNAAKGLSSFYGVSRLDFYFLQAIPILLMTYLPFFLYGVVSTGTKLMNLKLCSLVYMLVFSAIEHKEFRFLYPLMPFLLLFTAIGFVKSLSNKSPRFLRFFISAMILVNFSIAFYFTQYHESGVIKITDVLRSKILSEQKDTPATVGFLTPCHSTPFQSHFHLKPEQADIWFLTCEPPLHLNSSVDIGSYMDESDEFYDDANQFLSDNFPKLTPTSRDFISGNTITGKYAHQWPDYLVIFEHLDPFMKGYLAESRYVEVERLFNSRFHWDYRRTGDLIVYRYVD